ncbi:MAG: MFS transporter [Actinomycetes bacterium]
MLSAVVLNFFLSHLGMFALLPILALYVRDSGASPTWVGLTLAAYTFTVRAAGLFTAGTITAVSDRAGSCLAMLVTGAALAVLALVPGAPLLPCLLLVGLGVNSNGLFIRSLLNRHTDAARLTTAYGTVSVAVNIAAAGGPFLGTLMYADVGARPVFLVSGLLYIAAAVASLLAPREQATAAARRVGFVATWGELARLTRQPGSARLVGVTVVGWVAYAQLFSALPLFLADVIGRRDATAAVFAVNAVTVVAVQRWVVATLARQTPRRGWTHLHSLVCGLVLFAASFLLLSVPGTGLAGVLVAVVVFSVAEAATTPAVDASFAALPSEQRLAPVNLRSSVNAVGETVGVFSGGTLYLVMERSVSSSAYWLVVASLALVAATVAGVSVARGRRQAAPRRALEPEGS